MYLKRAVSATNKVYTKIVPGPSEKKSGYIFPSFLFLYKLFTEMSIIQDLNYPPPEHKGREMLRDFINDVIDGEATYDELKDKYGF